MGKWVYICVWCDAKSAEQYYVENEWHEICYECYRLHNKEW